MVYVSFVKLPPENGCWSHTGFILFIVLFIFLKTSKNGEENKIYKIYIKYTVMGILTRKQRNRTTLTLSDDPQTILTKYETKWLSKTIWVADHHIQEADYETKLFYNYLAYGYVHA